MDPLRNDILDVGPPADRADVIGGIVRDVVGPPPLARVLNGPPPGPTFNRINAAGRCVRCLKKAYGCICDGRGPVLDDRE